MDMYKRIGIVCRQIPAGRVATYGQVALLCGKPQNSRQVGYALKKGLSGEKIPAYRVVNSRGILSGAAYFETYDMQKLLLEEEGVAVELKDEAWWVDLKQYGWKNTLEDVYLLQDMFEEAERDSMTMENRR